MQDVMSEDLMREILTEGFHFSSPTELQKEALNQCPYDGGAREWIVGETSSGKTIVPLTAFYASRLKAGETRKLLFLEPYRALASQKKQEFQRLLPDMDILVSTSEHCSDDGSILNGRCDAAVVVYEKAFLVETGTGRFFRQYSHIVFDEIGIVESGERGLKADYLLHYACQIERANIYVLASLYCDWEAYLSCYHFCVRGKTARRPIQIESCSVDLSGKPGVPEEKEAVENTVLNELVCLCRKHLERKRKILIFAANKAMVRALAINLSKELYGSRWRWEFTPEKGRDDLYQKLDMLPEDIKNVFGTDDDIRAYYDGISFHHAAMPEALREIIEDAYLYRDELNIVCSTETLAFGLNSKADVAIIAKMDKWEHNQNRFITANEYHNYVGRAGRLGAREKGWSYTLLTGMVINGVRDVERWKNLDNHMEITEIKSQMRCIDVRPDKMLMLLHYFDREQEMSPESLRDKILTYPNADEIVGLPEFLHQELDELKKRSLIRTEERGGKTVYALTIWGESMLGYVFSCKTYDWIEDVGSRLLRQEKHRQEGTVVPIEERIFEMYQPHEEGLDTSPLRFLYEVCGNPEIYDYVSLPFRKDAVAKRLIYLMNNADALFRLMESERVRGHFSHKDLKDARSVLRASFESGPMSRNLTPAMKRKKSEQDSLERLKQVWPVFQRYMLAYALLLWLNSISLTDIYKKTGFQLNTLNIVTLKITYMSDALLHRFAGKLSVEMEQSIRLTQASLQHGVRRDVLWELHEKGIVDDFVSIDTEDGRRIRVLAQTVSKAEKGRPYTKALQMIENSSRFGDNYYKYIQEKFGGDF